MRARPERVQMCCLAVNHPSGCAGSEPADRPPGNPAGRAEERGPGGSGGGEGSDERLAARVPCPSTCHSAVQAARQGSLLERWSPRGDHPQPRPVGAEGGTRAPAPSLCQVPGSGPLVGCCLSWGAVVNQGIRPGQPGDPHHQAGASERPRAGLEGPRPLCSGRGRGPSRWGSTLSGRCSPPSGGHWGPAALLPARYLANSESGSPRGSNLPRFGEGALAFPPGCSL